MARRAQVIEDHPHNAEKRTNALLPASPFTRGSVICTLRDVQGALYFPFIAVPPTAWWTRIMLYWDGVGTIVPDSYIQDPELHSEYTLELIRAGVVQQVLPHYAGNSLAKNFGRYLHLLSGQEIDRRRRNLSMGHYALIHREKWLTYRGGLQEIQSLGLAPPEVFSRSGAWIPVEAATAQEFMAALALSLCETAGVRGWGSSERNISEVWVPTTNRSSASQALLAGLEPVPDTLLDAERSHIRIRGEMRAFEVRTHLMERLLPVPDTTIPVSKLIEFRKKHGNLLPAFRRYLESKIDESLMIPDPILRSRFMDHIEDELLERTQEAEVYLQELGLQRISRSSVLRILKFIPVLKDPIETAQDLADNLRTSQGLESEPLAYLAFAHVTFTLSMQTYRVDPATGRPLIEAFSV